MKSYEWQRPIEPDLYKYLQFEKHIAKRGFSYKDPRTNIRYFVKKYSDQAQDRAPKEDLGLSLCREYGATTPGHLLTHDKQEGAILIQQLVPISRTLGTFYTEYVAQNDARPDEDTRARMLSGLSVSQVTEVFINWITDYLTFNWDPHPDNYLLERIGDKLLVAVDKGRTGYFIGHPQLLLESPIIEE